MNSKQIFTYDNFAGPSTSSIPDKVGKDKPDSGQEVENNSKDDPDFLGMKLLDANRYATKKTIAQGMLDIALLTANASQLKYILQVGEKHEFYTLMLTLISISIILQILQGILCVVMGTALSINEKEEQKTAEKCNNICLCINIISVAVNVVISAFDMKETDTFLNADTNKVLADSVNSIIKHQS